MTAMPSTIDQPLQVVRSPRKKADPKQVDTWFPLVRAATPDVDATDAEIRGALAEITPYLPAMITTGGVCAAVRDKVIDWRKRDRKRTHADFEAQQRQETRRIVIESAKQAIKRNEEAADEEPRDDPDSHAAHLQRVATTMTVHPAPDSLAVKLAHCADHFGLTAQEERQFKALTARWQQFGYLPSANAYESSCV